MIKSIFVDMDGVLCDFFGRYLDLYGKAEENDDELSKNKQKEIRKKRYHDFIDSQQFASLDPMPDFEQAMVFLNRLKKDFGIAIYILSSTSNEDYFDSISGQKKKWLKDHAVKFEAIFVPGKRHKRMYAGAGNILIDDTLSNVEDWNNNGGIAIYHQSWDESIAQIRSMIDC